MNPILIIQHMKWNIDMVKIYFEYWFPLMCPILEDLSYPFFFL